MQQWQGACTVTWGRIRHAWCPPLPQHQGHKGSEMQGERGDKLPPQASLAAHLRSGGATEPAIHPTGRGGAQAVRLAHRSKSPTDLITIPCINKRAGSAVQYVLAEFCFLLSEIPNCVFEISRIVICRPHRMRTYAYNRMHAV